nr:immunoglobulin heavy chain junction region [Mus musculus]
CARSRYYYGSPWFAYW